MKFDVDPASLSLRALVEHQERLGRLARFRPECVAPRDAASRALDARWAATLDRLPFEPGRIHAYTPNETGYYGGGAHVGLPCDLRAGRLRRDTFDALCKPRRKFHNAEWTGPLPHPPSCVRCLERVEALAAAPPSTLHWHPVLAPVAGAIEGLADAPLRRRARSWIAAFNMHLERDARHAPCPLDVPMGGALDDGGDLRVTWARPGWHCTFLFRSRAPSTWAVRAAPSDPPAAAGTLDELEGHDAWEPLWRLARAALHVPPEAPTRARILDATP